MTITEATPAPDEAAVIDTALITKTLTRFGALAHDVAIAQQEHGDATYDYRDPSDNKKCRSALFALRRIKGSIETARKSTKQPLLDAGREVDRQAKLLEGQISALIDPHQLQLDRIEREEQERVARHREVLNQLDIYKCSALDATKNSADFEALIKCVEEINIDGLEEFAEAGRNRQADALEALMSALDRTTELERQAAELEQLRAEAAERERESQRIARHKARLDRIVELRNRVHAPDCSTPLDVRDLISLLNSVDLSGLEEFTQEAEQAKASALEYLRGCLARVMQVAEDEKRRRDELERQAAELERLRAQVAAAAAPATEPAASTPIARGNQAHDLIDPPSPVAGTPPAVAGSAQAGTPQTRTVRQCFIDDLCSRMAGKTRDEVASAVAHGTLHSCISVDWTAWRLVCAVVPAAIPGPLG